MHRCEEGVLAPLLPPGAGFPALDSLRIIHTRTDVEKILSHRRGGRYGGRGGGLTGGAGGAGFCRALSLSWYALGLKGAL